MTLHLPSARRAAILAVLATIGLVACRSATTPAPPDASAAALEIAQRDGGMGADVALDELCHERFAGVPDASGRLVGLLTDSGSINDGTFNQFAYEGLQAGARCFGFETTYVASGRSDDHAMHLDGLVSQGVEAVVTVGFPLTETTVEGAATHPDIAFIGLDQAAEGGDNYARITFRDDQAGYLAGVAAALVTESGVLGVVAGPDDIPPVVALAEGFAAGATEVDPRVEVLTTHLPSFSDPQAGRAAATSLAGRGADVVYGPAGLTGSGAIRAAAGAGLWVIGVDQDQHLTTFEGGRVDGADRIVTSSVKRVDLAVFLQLADLAQGTFAGGPVTLDAASGGITYAPAHDAALPDGFGAHLERVRAGLADGSRRTGLEQGGAADAA